MKICIIIAFLAIFACLRLPAQIASLAGKAVSIGSPFIRADRRLSLPANRDNITPDLTNNRPPVIDQTSVANDYPVIKRNQLFRNQAYKQLTGSQFKFKRLMISSGIPYLLHLIKTKNKTPFRLTCQKSFYGASKKACKRVNSLTFVIPICR